MTTGRKFAIVFVFVLALGMAAGVLGNWAITEVGADSGSYEDLKVFTEVLEAVEKNYVEPVESKALIYNAVSGMLRALDPHSAFMTPDGYKEMRVDTKGEFGGLGIQIAIKNNMLTVIAPIDDTPAYRAGILAGDLIVKIDGASTQEMSLMDAVNKMRGPKGTPVTISVQREGAKALKDYTIVRDIIKIQSVKSRVIDDTIGYVKLTQFQERSAEDIEAAVKELDSKGVTSLILDLRNNPGGLLKSAVDVSSLFLPHGSLSVYIKARSGERTEYRTGGRYQFERPMVVLVNQGSASASEIVAGALKDYKRAVILGVTTFGKGSVQSVMPLSDGSAIRLTTAKYYTPSGTSIQNTGIKPDIEVKLKAATGAAEHPVMREKDLDGHLGNEQKRDTEAETGEQQGGGEETEKAVFGHVADEDDTQLQRALDLLKTWNIFREQITDTADAQTRP